jgi:hypothetical protein
MIEVKLRPEVALRLRRILWQSVAIGLLAALAAHLVLLLLFKPMIRSAKPPSSQGRFTLMVNPSNLPSDDPWGIRSALKYGDPTLFAKPDYNSGFSSYIKTRLGSQAEPPDLPSEPDLAFAGLLPGRFSIQSPALLVASLPSGLAFQTEALNPRQAPFSEAPPSPLPSFEPPLWLDASFKPLAKVSDASGDIAKALRQFQGKQLDDSVLAVRDAGSDLPPEIRVVKSCGQASLDAMAVRSLMVSIDSLPGLRFQDDSSLILILKWTSSSRMPDLDEEAVRK